MRPTSVGERSELDAQNATAMGIALRLKRMTPGQRAEGGQCDGPGVLRPSGTRRARNAIRQVGSVEASNRGSRALVDPVSAASASVP